jgi:hypothetical protein
VPESGNTESARLNPAHVGDVDAILRTVAHIPAQAVHSCGDYWANVHAGSVRQRATVPVSKSKVTHMNKLVSIVFAAGLALFTAGAQAMPLAAIDASNGAVIIQVAQGCGPGGHRGPFGHCRPLY